MKFALKNQPIGEQNSLTLFETNLLFRASQSNSSTTRFSHRFHPYELAESHLRFLLHL